MTDCPVCYSPLVRSPTGYCEYAICEEEEHCPVCGYFYEYLYGGHALGYKLRGHGIIFTWSYSDRDVPTHARLEAHRIVEEAARRCLMEDLLKEVNESRKATTR
jgi:hypothetical protein